MDQLSGKESTIIELRPHQRAAVDRLDNGKILNGGVGSGKSRASVAYYLEKEAPRDVYVITTAKKRDSLDWHGEFAAGRVYRPDPDGPNLDPTVGVLRVDSWNNISKYIDVRDAFFIFDEQRLVGSGAWVKSFYKIARANRWVLLSATPGDTWFDYLPAFIANGHFKNRSQFSEQHVVWKPYTKFPTVLRYTGVNKLERLKHQLLVEMPFERHTTRHTHIVNVSYDQRLFRKVLKDRWHVYEERPLKNVSELFSVMRKVVNTDSSRLAAIRTLMSQHPRLIVFYNFDYELELLRTLGHVESWSTDSSSPTTPSTPSEAGFDGVIAEWKGTEPCQTTSNQSDSTISGENSTSTKFVSFERRGSRTSSSDSTSEATGLISVFPAGSRSKSSTDISVPIAEWNGHKHQEIPQTDKWVYLVQYVAGSEGWNCTTTDAMVFYSLTYSYKNFEQGYGRIDRLDTPYTDLHYYVLNSDSYIDKAIWGALKDKKSFNMAKFVENTVGFAKN